MKNLATTIAAMIVFVSPLFGETPSRTTEKVKGDCDVWVEVQDPHNYPDAVNDRIKKVEEAIACAAYIEGAANAMINQPSWLDDTHKHIAVGNWEDSVSLKQLVLIFTDYVDQNPASLNKPAPQTLRKATEAAGLYTYATLP